MEELLPDILVLIFNKLRLKEKLTIVPRVCKSWNHVVFSPTCWQTIDLLDWCSEDSNVDDTDKMIDLLDWCSEDSNVDDIDKMVRFLVTRSSGALREIIACRIENDLTFSFLVDHSRSLRTLEIPWSSVTDSIMEQVAEKLSGVTRINLCYCYDIGVQGLTAIGKNCKSLNGLKRNKHPLDMKPRVVQIEEATTIAATMPKLKHLEMTFNRLNTKNVEKIITSCPELEFLDIRGCVNVDLNPNWFRKRAPNLMVLGPQFNYHDWFEVDDWISDSGYSNWEHGFNEHDENDDYGM